MRSQTPERDPLAAVETARWPWANAFTAILDALRALEPVLEIIKTKSGPGGASDAPTGAPGAVVDTHR